MGKKKIDTTKRIQKNTDRLITYYKRKKGLLKKAIELSNLCDQQMYLAIYDSKNRRLVTFQSHDDFSPENFSKISAEAKNHEKYNLRSY